LGRVTVATLDYPPYRPLHLTQIDACDRAIGALEARATGAARPVSPRRPGPASVGGWMRARAPRQPLVKTSLIQAAWAAVKCRGADHFDRRHHERLARRLVHRLTQLGYHVDIQDAA